MSEFKEISAHFNVYDFLNPIISGSYFIIGCCIINFTFILDCLNKIGFNNINIEENLNIFFIILFYLVVSYILGIIMQFLGQFIFSKVENRMIEASLKEPGKAKLLHKYPFNSSFKLKIFRDDAQDIFNKKGLEKFDKNDNDHNSYFYAFCVYHNQIYGFSQKMEKLREVWGISQELTIASLLLIILVMVNFRELEELEREPFILLVVFGFLAFVFFWRAKWVLRNRIRMNYSVFHVSKDLYSMSFKVDNLHKLRFK